MKNKYLLSAFFGGVIGAGCVLIAVYVTNAKVLVIEVDDVNAAVTALHTRINDFYIFAGIVITLLLAINVGVYIKADQEVDHHMRENVQRYIDDIRKESRNRKRKNIDEGAHNPK